MNITLYVPRELEEALERHASAAHQTPSLYVQSLVRRELEGERDRYSDAFAALAGSWRDERDVDEILGDIRKQRTNSKRPPLK